MSGRKGFVRKRLFSGGVDKNERHWGMEVPEV